MSSFHTESNKFKMYQAFDSDTCMNTHKILKGNTKITAESCPSLH